MAQVLIQPDSVRSIRATLGLSQRRLAEYCQVSRETIAALERGGCGHSPRLSTLQKITRGVYRALLELTGIDGNWTMQTQLSEDQDGDILLLKRWKADEREVER